MDENGTDRDREVDAPAPVGATPASGSAGSAGTVVRRNGPRSRYEIVVDDQVVGIADFVDEGDVVVFPHTVIDPARRGQGLAVELVRGALDDVRRTGKRVHPACWYVRQFIQDNEAYQDLLAS